MLSVQNYAYINARLRAKLSQLLPRDTLVKMASAQTLEESLLFLSDTYYAEFYEMYRKSGDLMAGEQALTHAHMERFANMGAGLTSNVRAFLRSLLMMHEIRYIKTALRVWFYREVGHKHASSLVMPSLRMSIAYTIDYDAMMACTSLADIATQLRDTPYAAVIDAEAATVLAKRSIYSLEVALDRAVFANMHLATLLLPAAERVVVQRLLGAYIDLENLQFGKTYLLYADEKAPLGSSEFLAGGLRLSLELWQELLHNDSLLRERLIDWYPALASLENVSLGRLIQCAQERLLEGNGRNALMQYPFSCAPIIGYFFLVENDLSKIITLANSKAYGVDTPTLMRDLMLV
jgi:vacuolar-type H+-ATPase subunit C/Vma6